MNTITDDEILNAALAIDPTEYECTDGEAYDIAVGRAVLALAEQKQAAALAEQLEMECIRKDQLIRHAENLQAHNAELQAELERERMRLAACGVVAMADTPASAAKERDMHPDYRSASCDDVARRVDECIAMRARIAELEAKAAQPAQVQYLQAVIDELQNYTRDLCRAVDDATEFASTVAPRAAWWGGVWAGHVKALDAARNRISRAAAQPAQAPDSDTVRLAALMQGLEMPPAAGAFSAGQLRAIGAAIADQAKRAVAPKPAQVAAPEGWQLVPVEPTLTMRSAARMEHNRMNWSDPLLPQAIYRAMLAAAPKREGGDAVVQQPTPPRHFGPYTDDDDTSNLMGG
jgi:hypothetical protein